MVDFSKYTYNGWGLSKSALIKLKELIDGYDIKRVIEFGSGQSTYFLDDIGVEYISFDDNPIYAAKLKNVMIRDIVQLKDDTFSDIIFNKINYFDICDNQPILKNTHSRQKNCFYKLNGDDISGNFDLVIIDGPHGNGRSIAFNVINPFLSERSFILVDDYNHYPFIDNLKIYFPDNKLYYSHNESGDYFEIYEIFKRSGNT